jgi:hypothetical protein
MHFWGTPVINAPVIDAIVLNTRQTGGSGALRRALSRGRDTVLRTAMQSGVAISLLWAAPAQAADGVEALLRELRQQLKEDQQEIRALKRQVDQLTKRVEQVTPAPGVPPPDARNVVVTQQPGNLPGRSIGPPYTAIGATAVGPPGAPPPVAAAPVASGGDKIRVSLSGQVNRAIIYGNDGKSSNFRNVDNSISSTRFRFLGVGQVTPETSVGTNIEVELRQNPSATTTLLQNLPQPAGSVSPTIRQGDVFVANQDWGGLRLGFGSTASFQTNEVDLSGTVMAHYVSAPDMNGGFSFRQRGAALVPGGAGGKLVLSPDGAFGPAVGSVFNFFGGLVRDARIRYDTPVWEGLQFSTSYVDGGAYDAALRLARSFDGFRLVAAVAGVDATHRNHTPVANLGYAGVPAGFIGGTSLAGVNAAPSAPVQADVSANGSRHFDGSFSVLADSGLSLTMAGGVRDPRYRDPLGRPLSPNLVYVKLGYQHDFFSFGRTAFSADFINQDELIFNGDNTQSYSLGLVQNIDATATELFASVRHESLHRSFGQFHPIEAAWTGARVRF